MINFILVYLAKNKIYIVLYKYIEMKQNHFIFGYAGNKRNEVQRIVDKLDLNNITTIVEPFCGSSALSYFMAIKEPNKYKYILNDINKNLIEIYNILKDEGETLIFEKKINDILSQEGFDKQKYLQVIKHNDIVSYFIGSKVKQIRYGLFPLNYKYKYIDLNNHIFTHFLRTENIEMTNIDAIDVVEKYKDDHNALIYLDPPYLSMCNQFYDDKRNLNIYEYLYNHDFVHSNIYTTLEKHWLVDLIFNKYIKLDDYGKTYQPTKNKVTHFFYRLCLK